jgi:hypothetical protein
VWGLEKEEMIGQSLRYSRQAKGSECEEKTLTCLLLLFKQLLTVNDNKTPRAVTRLHAVMFDIALFQGFRNRNSDAAKSNIIH